MSIAKLYAILLTATLIALLPLGAAFSLPAKPVSAPNPNPSSKVYEGFLVDRACAAMYKHDGGNIAQKASSHTRTCCLEPSCSEAGYSLYVSKYQAWFDLDDKGNQLARELIKKSKIVKGIKVQVTGEIKRGELRTNTIHEL